MLLRERHLGFEFVLTPGKSGNREFILTPGKSGNRDVSVRRETRVFVLTLGRPGNKIVSVRGETRGGECSLPASGGAGGGGS